MSDRVVRRTDRIIHWNCVVSSPKWSKFVESDAIKWSDGTTDGRLTARRSVQSGDVPYSSVYTAGFFVPLTPYDEDITFVRDVGSPSRSDAALCHRVPAVSAVCCKLSDVVLQLLYIGSRVRTRDSGLLCWFETSSFFVNYWRAAPSPVASCAPWYRGEGNH